MAAPRGNDSRRTSWYNLETSGKDEGNESLKHPLLALRPVEGSKSWPSASFPDEHVHQSYGYPDMEAAVVSSDMSLLPENALLFVGGTRSVRGFKHVFLSVASLFVLGLTGLGGLMALNIKHAPGVLGMIIVCAANLSRLLVILGAALGIGLGYIWLFQTYTKKIATRVFPGFLMMCVLLSLGRATLSARMAGNGTESWMLLIIALGWCVPLVLLLLRSRLCDSDLSLKTLKMASQLISDNLQLLNVWMLSMLIGLIAMLALLKAFFRVTMTHYYALAIVPNPDAAPGAPCGGEDLDAVPCSIVNRKALITEFFVVFFGGLCIWSLLGWKLNSCHKRAVRRTVTVWYFDHISRSTSHRSSTSDSRSRSGVSLRTLCNASIKSSVIVVARSLASGLRAVGDACQSAVAIFTRPLSSAKLTFSRLKRNFCSTVAVDAFADYVLKLYAFLWILIATVVLVGSILLTDALADFRFHALYLYYTENGQDFDSLHQTVNENPHAFDRLGRDNKLLVTLLYTMGTLGFVLLSSLPVFGWWLSIQRTALAAILDCKRQEEEEWMTGPK